MTTSITRSATRPALIDISPLYKYEVRGKDALRLVNRVITRDAAKCAVGQALYGCLCEDDGAVIQDGTVFRLAEDYFRFHLADPSLRWLRLNAVGMDLSIEEVSEKIAALALQGPNALKILEQIVDRDLSSSTIFSLDAVKIGAVPVIVSRTGYTGDLGYEIWFDAAHALSVWDIFMEKGKAFGIKPAGMLALDVARLEAGFILLEVDYIGAEKAMIAAQRYSPFEIGLGWTVDMKKEHFVGGRALKKITNQHWPRANRRFGDQSRLTMNTYFAKWGCRRRSRSRLGVAECRSTKKIDRSAMRRPAHGRRR